MADLHSVPSRLLLALEVYYRHGQKGRLLLATSHLGVWGPVESAWRLLRGLIAAFLEHVLMFVARSAMVPSTNWRLFSRTTLSLMMTRRALNDHVILVLRETPRELHLVALMPIDPSDERYVRRRNIRY